ncbi:hypothetical protein FB446DRAFT_721940 [Lentinula raphanica]|nr:hypothetical protein FB446DRAFT_721940 [Lentinula raphanica]
MSSSVPPVCQITENPDIAGIGVRLSIYIPAVLVTINSGYVAAKISVDVLTGKLSEYFDSASLRSLSDGSSAPSGSDIQLNDLEAAEQQETPSPHGPGSINASSTAGFSESWFSDNGEYLMEKQARGYLSYLSDHPHYFESSRALERSLFLIGSAIIVSAFLNASNFSLPPYHALLVLNLSLLNNLAGSILLPIRIIAVCAEIWFGDRKENVLMPSSLWYLATLVDVFGLAVVQTLVIIAFGTWFWVSATFNHTFSGYSMTVDKLISSATYNSTLSASPGGPMDPSQCVSRTLYWAFINVPVESSLPLQIISLMFYIGTAVFPILGPFIYVTPTIVILRSIPLLLAMGFSCAIYLFGILLPRLTARLIYTLLPKIYHLAITLPHIRKPLFTLMLSPKALSTRLIFFTIVITNLTTVLYLIISTEKVISINSASRGGSVVISGPQWTYGQTLALLTAVIGVLTYVAELIGEWREVTLERRKRLREEVIGGEDAKGVESGKDSQQSRHDVTADVEVPWVARKDNYVRRRVNSI